MKTIAALLMALWTPALLADTADDWQRQSYRQSKRLPDLHHAVDVELADGMQPPAAFELKDGKLSCQTCHGLEKMDETPYDKIDKKAANFLRGGPYRPLEKFCYNCHDKESHQRPNVHLMLDESGDIKKEHCLYCHEKVHEQRDEPLAREQLKLRLPAEKLCFGCHLKTPHLNALEHQGAKPKDNMKKHMDQAAREHGIILPLAADGRVTCVSCHSPHPEGVMDINNPAGAQVSADVKKGVKYQEHSWDQVFRADKDERLLALAMQHGERPDLGYRRLSNEVLLRLPALDGSLCLSCHEFER
ncbi:hypothetical protein [Methylomonas sp. HYX-M1]|uniref:hypothetical protein n=1 Tax=Methylomonas sp. HYX-M1 TaxID=3139307 RepID=UPI00345C50BD